MVGFQPPPTPVSAPVRAEPVDPFQSAPRWRFQARDLLALAAIAAAVWFAIRGAEGLPFHSSGSLGAAEAADQVSAWVTLDRNELRAITRKAAAAEAAASNGGETSSGGANGSTGPSTNGGSGTKGQPKPPTGGTSEPLVQATIPGVGSVTIEKPDLLDDPVGGLALPDVPPPLESTPTLPLP